MGNSRGRTCFFYPLVPRRELILWYQVHSLVEDYMPYQILGKDKLPKRAKYNYILVGQHGLYVQCTFYSDSLKFCFKFYNSTINFMHISNVFLVEVKYYTLKDNISNRLPHLFPSCFKFDLSPLRC